MKRRTAASLAALAAAWVVSMPAEAEVASADDKVEALINLLVAQGVITPEKAQSLRAATATASSSSAKPASTQAASAAGSSTKTDGGAAMAAVDNQSAVRQPEAPRVPQPPKVAASAGYRFPHNMDPSVDPSAPVVRSAGFAAQENPWTDRIRLDGDIRIRWQAEYLDKQTSAKIPNWAALSTSGTTLPVTNYISDANRARLRYRARFGVTARIDDHFSAVIRLAAGNLTEPTSTDQTLGDFLNRDGVGIDRAYLQWTPTKSLTFTAGRMANPFYTTNLLFDGDVNPEGIAGTIRHNLKAGYLFATASMWYIQENGNHTPDRFTYAAQVGAAGIPLASRTHLRLAATYYDWSHYRGKVGDLTTASTVLGQGNTLMDLDPRANNVLPGIASQFRIVEGLGAVSQRVGKRYAVSAAFDFAANIAYDPKALRALPLLTQPNGNTAWLSALTVGDPNVAEFGQWQVTASYRNLKPDSVIAAFTEGDYNPGGTNREIETIEGLVGLDHNAWLQLSYFHNRFLDGPHYEYDAVRTQLNVRF